LLFVVCCLLLLFVVCCLLLFVVCCLLLCVVVVVCCLLFVVVRGVVAALWKPSRDAWRRRGLLEANLIDLIDVSESSHNAPAKHINPYSRRPWLGFTRT